MAASPAGIGRPVCVNLASSQPNASNAFPAAVFGWDVVLSADPQCGGYAMARVDGHDVARMGPSQAGAAAAI